MVAKSRVVVDTNVLVAANGRNTHADLECQLACSERVQAIRDQELVLLDDQDLIMAEYQRNLEFSGQPGLGDAFFAYVFDHQYAAEFVSRIPVTISPDNSRGFEELPVNRFKAGDRVLLTVGLVGQAPILNATDSDWDEQAELLDELSVQVVQLCEQHAKRKGR